MLLYFHLFREERETWYLARRK